MQTIQHESQRQTPGADHFTPAHNSLSIDRKQMSEMLAAMGVDLSHPLAPSFILGSFDVMAAGDLADRLPSYCNFEGALQGLHTMRYLQPRAVREVQLMLLDALCNSVLHIDDDREQAIRSRLGDISPTLN